VDGAVRVAVKAAAEVRALREHVDEQDCHLKSQQPLR
jgi:hypothetical protein